MPQDDIQTGGQEGGSLALLLVGALASQGNQRVIMFSAYCSGVLEILERAPSPTIASSARQLREELRIWSIQLASSTPPEEQA